MPDSDSTHMVGYCPSCGRARHQGERFCGGCGRELDRGLDEPDPGQALPASPGAENSVSPPGAEASVPIQPAATTQTLDTLGVAAKPRVGGWPIPIILFGWVAGLVGWIVNRDADPRRANHVLKWGVLSSLIYAAVGIAVVVVVLVIATSQSGAGAAASGADGSPSHIVVVQGNSTTGGGSWCYTDPTNAHLIFTVTLQNTGAGAGTVQIEPWRRFNDGSTNDGTGDLTNNLTIPAHSTKRYQATVSYNPLTKAPIECRVYLGPNFTYQQDIRVLH